MKEHLLRCKLNAVGFQVRSCCGDLLFTTRGQHTNAVFTSNNSTPTPSD